MKLKRLTINRLPGIDQPFEIDSPGAGVHVIFGPNAIGKSSICRAVEGLYWDDHGSTESTSVTGQFELDGDTWWVEREGSRLRWRCAGEDRVPPSIPGSHHHRCFFLRLRDLIDPSLDGTHDIASEIRRQMSGGFDLHQIVENFFSGVRGRHGRRQRNEFNAAAKEVAGSRRTPVGAAAPGGYAGVSAGATRSRGSGRPPPAICPSSGWAGQSRRRVCDGKGRNRSPPRRLGQSDRPGIRANGAAPGAH